MKQISTILCTLLASVNLVAPAFGSASAQELNPRGKTRIENEAKKTATVTQTSKTTAKANPQAGKPSKISAPAVTATAPAKGASAEQRNSPIPATSKSTEKTESSASSAKPKTLPATDKDKVNSAKQAHHTRSGSTGRAMLVPPPPPSIPTMSEMGVSGLGPTMIFVGENIDYMSAADLHDLQEKTDREIQRCREKVEDFASSAEEKRQKAGSFDQLYEEGVISRHELETSKRDNERAVQELADAKQTLTALEQKHVRIERRLLYLSKVKKPAKVRTARKRR